MRQPLNARMHNPATALMELFGRVARVLPDVRGRGRIAIAVSSLLMKAGADLIVQGKMARGRRMRLDCRVPSQCWAFFRGRQQDRVALSLLRRGGIALDVGANIGFYTVPLAIQAKAIGSKIVAFEPLESNAAWLRHRDRREAAGLISWCAPWGRGKEEVISNHMFLEASSFLQPGETPAAAT
jgi:hypothetical protein